MNFLRRIFESSESKTLRRMLDLDGGNFKKGFYTIELGQVYETSKKIYKAKFEIVNGKFTLELTEIVGFNDNKATVQKFDSDISTKFNGRRMKLNKDLLKQVIDKYENILKDYQLNQEERYSQFIKELHSGNSSFKVETLGSEGIEEGKEITLYTNQGINLIFTREPHSLLIKIKDSEELYLRRLEYSMDKENFVNAKIRKLNISPEEKEQLISFVKNYLDSKEVVNLFTEEEILLSKINA